MNAEKKITRFKIFTLILGTAAVILMLTAIAVWFTPPGFEVTTYSMNAYVSQTVYGKNRETAAEEAANNIAVLEDKLSWRVAGSEIERLNLNAGKNFLSIDKDIVSILKVSREVSEKSGGFFDVTIAPLSRLWAFEEEKNRVPEDSLIQSILPDIQYQNILFEETGSGENQTTKVALKTRTTALDLSTVAKGAACEEAVKTYQEQGVSRGIVYVGSSVGVYGKKWFGLPWVLSIQNPSGEGTIGELSIQEGFVSTVGSNQKSFEEEGVQYHHVLNPKTGYPAESGLLSVTVWSNSGVLSDALAAACFVTGYEDSLSLLQEYDASALFVTEDKEIYTTQGIEEQFKLTDTDYRLMSGSK